MTNKKTLLIFFQDIEIHLIGSRFLTTEPGLDVFWGGRRLGQRPLVPLLLLGPQFYQLSFFLVHHPVNRDDRHLRAHAMASDFTVAAWIRCF
jgi:hypothetical protein